MSLDQTINDLWQVEHLVIFFSFCEIYQQAVEFTLLLEYCQHLYENTVHTYQISCQLAEKLQRYDMF